MKRGGMSKVRRLSLEQASETLDRVSACMTDMHIADIERFLKVIENDALKSKVEEWTIETLTFRKNSKSSWCKFATFYEAATRLLSLSKEIQRVITDEKLEELYGAVEKMEEEVVQ